MNNTLKTIIASSTQSTQSISTSTSQMIESLSSISGNSSEILKVNNVNTESAIPLGLTLLNKELTPAQGVGIEIVITFVLMLTVFACIDSQRKDLHGSFPLTIGFAVTIGCLFGVMTFKEIFLFFLNR